MDDGQSQSSFQTEVDPRKKSGKKSKGDEIGDGEVKQPHSKPKGPKKKWTHDEEQALRKGVQKHGQGKWRQIQQDPEFNKYLNNRSNVDLKDKWRNLSMESAAARRAARGADGTEGGGGPKRKRKSGPANDNHTGKRRLQPVRMVRRRRQDNSDSEVSAESVTRSRSSDDDNVDDEKSDRDSAGDSQADSEDGAARCQNIIEGAVILLGCTNEQINDINVANWISRMSGVKLADIETNIIKEKLLKMHEEDRLRIEGGNYKLSGVLRDLAYNSMQKVKNEAETATPSTAMAFLRQARGTARYLREAEVSDKAAHVALAKARAWELEHASKPEPVSHLPGLGGIGRELAPDGEPWTRPESPQPDNDARIAPAAVSGREGPAGPEFSGLRLESQEQPRRHLGIVPGERNEDSDEQQTSLKTWD